MTAATPSTTLAQGLSRSDITLVYTVGRGPHDGREIYVGNTHCVARDLAADYGVNCVLNVDLDEPQPLRHSARTDRRQAKVGLVDGYGNSAMTLIAALYAIDQLLTVPNEAQVRRAARPFSPKNLVVQCATGGSRSATVAALYAYYKFERTVGEGRSFDDVYLSILEARAPHARGGWSDGICEIGHEITETYDDVFPTLSVVS